MLNSDICETLLAVDEVELSFERTVRNINNIQQRYNMVSSLKRKAAREKESFEAEIQAAIMEPKPTKGSDLSRKSPKKKKFLPLVGSERRINRGKKERLTTVQESFKEKSVAAIKEPSLNDLKNRPKSLKKKSFPRVKKDKKTKMTKLSMEIPLPALPPIAYEENAPQTICFRATNYTYEIHSTAPQVVPRKPFADLIRRLYRAARRKAQQEAIYQQDHELSLDCSCFCHCSCSCHGSSSCYCSCSCSYSCSCSSG